MAQLIATVVFALVSHQCTALRDINAPLAFEPRELATTAPIPTSKVRSAVSAALPGATVLWEAAGEALMQNWVTDGWWLKKPITLACADREVTGEKCSVDGGGTNMVMWIENTSGVDDEPIVLRGLKITGGRHSVRGTHATHATHTAQAKHAQQAPQATLDSTVVPQASQLLRSQKERHAAHILERAQA